MPDWKLPMAGGCRCAKVRFAVNRAPLLTSVCHCTGCQRMTASAFSTTVTVPAAGFAITEGKPVIGGVHGADARHFHCDWCKSWLFTRPEPEMGFVNVRATMLDETGWFVPFVESYTSEALPWVQTPATHRFEKFPAMADYEQLTADFHDQVGTRRPRQRG